MASDAQHTGGGDLSANQTQAAGHTPHTEGAPKDHLTVISEATETSNGVCSVVDSAPVSLSPGRRPSHHGNGRPRAGSRTSVSYHGSPRPSLQPAAGHEDGDKPNDYLLWAILACLCPVWPINIVGLTFSVMSRNSLAQGNVDGARRLGRNAKILSLVSFIGGIIIIVTAVTVNLT
ncbi:proline-rich transmembrane protein 2 [Engraulis encrasicolus]|uniref:proline-rich transmembrane protein 2 n=1 Tax=Engraulis encrasicolus TaxID=184585 RepID=UPI002FD4A924